ncbi:MAG: dihydrolipoamide acetyltransferase, partial [Phycisphaerae bacterium]|nr:dihydrolipoamide acetyltransferase [Phycisphaerae bacterium]
MPIEITMPRLSDTMEVGTILHWHVAVGDEVSSGDLLADIETDKATMELQSFDDGKVESLLINEGEAVDVGTIIATIASEDEEPTADNSPSSSDIPVAKEAEAPAATVHTPSQKQSSGPRVSPVARRLAEEHGVDLASIQGSGPSGRIIKRDVLQQVATEATTSETTSAAETTKVPQPVAPA